MDRKKTQQCPTSCSLQETRFSTEDTNRLKVKGWRKTVHEKGNQRRAGVDKLLLDKTDFKPKIVNKKQKRLVCNNKEASSSRGYNTCKYLCTQHKSP